jgi:hypothetical protein
MFILKFPLLANLNWFNEPNGCTVCGFPIVLTVAHAAIARGVVRVSCLSSALAAFLSGVILLDSIVYAVAPVQWEKSVVGKKCHFYMRHSRIVLESWRGFAMKARAKGHKLLFNKLQTRKQENNKTGKDFSKMVSLVLVVRS